MGEVAFVIETQVLIRCEDADHQLCHKGSNIGPYAAQQLHSAFA